MYRVMKAPKNINKNARCKLKVAQFLSLCSWYRFIFLIKFIANKSMISSNNHALKINSREYGVGDVSPPASRKVPTAIAIAKAINKTAIKRVEKSILVIFFSMPKYFVQI